MPKVYDEASEITRDGAVVKVTGPDDVSVKLTAKAALKTAGRLDEAALDALIESAEGEPRTSTSRSFDADEGRAISA